MLMQHSNVIEYVDNCAVIVSYVGEQPKRWIYICKLRTVLVQLCVYLTALALEESILQVTLVHMLLILTMNIIYVWQNEH